MPKWIYVLSNTCQAVKNFQIRQFGIVWQSMHFYLPIIPYLCYGEFYQFNLSSCIRQQNSLTAQFVSFSLSNLANIFYPPQFLQ